MKISVAYVSGFVFMFLTSFIVTLAGYWYITVLFGVVAGLAISQSKLVGFISAIGGVVGMALYISVIDGSQGFAQTGLLSGIIGIPGGALPILVITALIMFALSFLGFLLGSSFQLNKKSEPREN